MKKITANTGSAKVKKLGQTAQSNHGYNERARVKGDRNVRNQSAK